MNLQPREVAELAEKACRTSPSAEELGGTRAANPILVMEPEGEPAYWLVPLIREEWACGFVTVALSGIVRQVGTFGANRSDKDSWIQRSYFACPPEDLLGEIREQYPGMVLSEPVFSFDRAPSRWAWRLQINPPNGDIIFICPRVWYTVPPSDYEQPMMQ